MPRRKNISKQTKIVLRKLAAAPDAWRYGYDISQETGIKSGTLYPMLIRLQDQGLLVAEWRDADEPGRPRRHVYRLRASGRQLVASLECDGKPSGAPTSPDEALA